MLTYTVSHIYDVIAICSVTKLEKSSWMLLLCRVLQIKRTLPEHCVIKTDTVVLN